MHTCAKYGADNTLLKATLDINMNQPIRFVNRLREALGGVEGKTIGMLGLAFKPNTDDMRDAKSLEIIGELLSDGASVKAYDPIAADNCRMSYPDITYCENAYQVAEGASALLLITEWNEFRFLNMERIRDAMERPVLFDGRNMYDPLRMKRLGFEYFSIGRLTPNGNGKS